MTGYVRPFKPELKIKDFESFRAIYCGLCHAIGKRYGLIMRLALTFDMCFLAMIAVGANGSSCERCEKRCIASPFKKKSCVKIIPELEFAADASVIFTYLKFMDGAEDNTGIKRIIYKLCALLVRGKYRKAVKIRPELADGAEKGLDKLHVLEKNRESSMDRAASAFSDSMEMMSEICDDPMNKRIVREILRQLGRWIYILDAYDDMDEDHEQGTYNPILLRYGDENKDVIKERIVQTLEMSQASIASSYELMDIKGYDAVLRNIIYMGLPAAVHEVASGCKNKRKKNNLKHL